MLSHHAVGRSLEFLDFFSFLGLLTTYYYFGSDDDLAEGSICCFTKAICEDFMLFTVNP
jgi:hypothetical protein